MQNVYKFYFHEIQPKDSVASDKLNATEEAQMQLVISDLKSHCSASLIAKMNQYLHEETNHDQG